MPVPTTFASLDTAAINNSPPGTESAKGNIDDYLRQGFAFTKQLYNGAASAPAVTVASAATTNIGSAASPVVTITGTTTITAFDTVADGIVRDVTFAAALTLTHNATSLILPGATNITTAAGDCATFLSLGSGNWRCTKYATAAGDANLVHRTGAESIAGVKSFSDDIVFSGSGKRIKADFSNATLPNRVLFQSSTTNGNTNVGSIPNGTATYAGSNWYNTSDPANAGVASVGISAAEVNVTADKAGTGTYLPINFYTSGSQRMQIAADGKVGVGISPNAPLHVYAAVSGGAPVASGSAVDPNVANRIQTGTVAVDTGAMVSGAVWLQARAAANYATMFDYCINPVGGLFHVGTTSALRTGMCSIATSGNSFGIVAMRNTGTTAGKYWGYGPDGSNNYIICNQAGTGMFMSDGATSWTASSDERIKDIIEPITGALEKVALLRTVIGKYKTDPEGKRRVFFIAQDMQKVLPEVVSSANDILGISYSDTTPLLAAAINELAAELAAAKQRSDVLEQRLAALESARP